MVGPDHCDTCRWLNEPATLAAVDDCLVALLDALARDDDEALNGMIVVVREGAPPGAKVPAVTAAAVREGRGISQESCRDLIDAFPLGDAYRRWTEAPSITIERRLTIGTAHQLMARQGGSFSLVAAWDGERWLPVVALAAAAGPAN
jgi:hypothetical protein